MKLHCLGLLLCMLTSDETVTKNGVISIQVGYLSAPTSSLDWFSREVSEFERKNPKVKVDVVDFDAPRHPQVPVDQNKKLPRNVVGIDGRVGYEAQYLVETNQLLPIESFLPDPQFDLSQYGPNTIAPVRIKGKTWGIPWLAHTELLVYDWTALNERGLADPPRNWEDLERFAKILTRTDQRTGEVKQWGLRISLGNDTVPQMILSKIIQDGGWVMKDGMFDLSHPAVAHSVSYFKHLVFKSGGVKIDSRPLDDVISDESVKYAMHIVPVEDLAGAARNPRLGLVPIPSSGQNVTAIRRRLYLAIRKSTPEEERASWEFVRWFARDDISLPTRLEGYPCVPNLTNRADFVKLENSGMLDLRYLYTAAEMGVQIEQPIPNQLKAFQTMWDGIRPALTGNVSFEELSAQASQKANAMLIPLDRVVRMGKTNNPQ